MLRAKTTLFTFVRHFPCGQNVCFSRNAYIQKFPYPQEKAQMPPQTLPHNFSKLIFICKIKITMQCMSMHTEKARKMHGSEWASSKNMGAYWNIMPCWFQLVPVLLRLVKTIKKSTNNYCEWKIDILSKRKCPDKLWLTGHWLTANWHCYGTIPNKQPKSTGAIFRQRFANYQMYNYAKVVLCGNYVNCLHWLHSTH